MRAADDQVPRPDPAGSNWVVEGLILAPTLVSEQAVRFMDCTVLPIASGPEWTPEPKGRLEMKPAGIAGPTSAAPARWQMFTTHRIATEVDAKDSPEAFTLALSRFRRCATGLVITARVPVGAPINAAPEALVQLTYAHDPAGTSHGPPAASKFGIVPTRAPTHANRWAAGLLEQVLAGNPSVGRLLEQFYVADESAYLAFTRRDEEYAVVDYCKVLEEISSQVAREHKEQIETQAAIGREIEAIVRTLRTRLDEASAVDAKSSAVRDAQLAIAAANLESQKRQIVKAGELLLVPSDARPVLDKVWKLRSSTASHAGGGDWPSDALVEARVVSLIYLSHFVASRHVRDQRMTLAEAVEKHKANTSSS